MCSSSNQHDQLKRPSRATLSNPPLSHSSSDTVQYSMDTSSSTIIHSSTTCPMPTSPARFHSPPPPPPPRGSPQNRWLINYVPVFAHYTLNLQSNHNVSLLLPVMTFFLPSLLEKTLNQFQMFHSKEGNPNKVARKTKTEVYNPTHHKPRRINAPETRTSM